MEKEAPNRINERITVPQVRVVGDGIEGGSAVMPTSQALRLAREQEPRPYRNLAQGGAARGAYRRLPEVPLPAEEEGQGA